MARGGPISKWSRHINIRYFWLKERIDSGEGVLEHLGTALMFVNILTKPVQGKQLAKERKGKDWQNGGKKRITLTISIISYG